MKCENNNNLTENVFINNLTNFFDYFYRNFPFMKNKKYIIELILSTQQTYQFLFTKVDLNVDSSQKIFEDNMKIAICHNFLTIYKQIKDKLPFRYSYKIKYKSYYELNNWSINKVFDLLKDISLSLGTNENIYLLFDNYAKRMDRLEIEFPNKSKLEIVQQVNHEYLYFYTKIIEQYLKHKNRFILIKRFYSKFIGI